MEKKMDYQEVLNEIRTFNKERNWQQYHMPKDLAISLNLEASELLENFQWRSSEEAIKNDMENIKEEVADVFIYLLQFVDALDLDLIEISHQKIAKNQIKYPLNDNN